MPSTRARKPRRRRSNRGTAIPTSMVRATAFWPTPPWATPSGTQTFGIRCSDPMMPTGATRIQVVGIATGVGILLPILSVILRDSVTLQVTCVDTDSIGGVYIPFNDPGFRGINGGMLNPGELSIWDGDPRTFPWCCALG